MADDDAAEDTRVDNTRVDDGPEPGSDRDASSERAGDWPIQAADTVVRIVDQVRTKTTDNIVLVVRAIVYGFVIAVLGLAILVMFVVALLRLTDAYIPIGDGVGSATWAAHGLLGLLMTILGLGAWMSRKGSSKPLALAAGLDVAIVIAVVFYGVVDGVS